jgi:molybdate transport system permease protein
MGASSWQVTRQLRLRWARAGIFAGSGLAFAHTMGEFGVVLMLGGNLEGKTRVSSIALYDLTQALDFEQAHHYAAVLLGVSMVLLIAVSVLQKQMEIRQPNR